MAAAVTFSQHHLMVPSAPRRERLPLHFKYALISMSREYCTADLSESSTHVSLLPML